MIRYHSSLIPFFLLCCKNGPYRRGTYLKTTKTESPLFPTLPDFRRQGKGDLPFS